MSRKPEEKFYQSWCFMLFLVLFPEHNIKMVQDGGHGRSDFAIVAHPFRSQRLPGLVWEIKWINRKFKKDGKRSIKDPERIKKDIESAKIQALEQLEDRRYRESVPPYATKVHEFALVFCGMFCVAAVRTLEHNAKEVWEQVGVAHGSIVDVGNADEEDSADEDDLEDEVA